MIWSNDLGLTVCADSRGQPLLTDNAQVQGLAPRLPARRLARDPTNVSQRAEHTVNYTPPAARWIPPVYSAYWKSSSGRYLLLVRFDGRHLLSC